MMLLHWAPVGVLAVANLVVANPVPASQLGQDKLGAVASESSICSNIGIDLLKAGGNAADAVSHYLCSVCAKADTDGALVLYSLLARSRASA